MRISSRPLENVVILLFSPILFFHQTGSRLHFLRTTKTTKPKTWNWIPAQTHPFSVYHLRRAFFFHPRSPEKPQPPKPGARKLPKDCPELPTKLMCKLPSVEGSEGFRSKSKTVPGDHTTLDSLDGHGSKWSPLTKNTVLGSLWFWAYQTGAIKLFERYEIFKRLQTQPPGVSKLSIDMKVDKGSSSWGSKKKNKGDRSLHHRPLGALGRQTSCSPEASKRVISESPTKVRRKGKTWFMVYSFGFGFRFCFGFGFSFGFIPYGFGSKSTGFVKCCFTLLYFTKCTTHIPNSFHQKKVSSLHPKS